MYFLHVANVPFQTYTCILPSLAKMVGLQTSRQVNYAFQLVRNLTDKHEPSSTQSCMSSVLVLDMAWRHARDLHHLHLRPI